MEQERDDSLRSINMYKQEIDKLKMVNMSASSSIQLQV